MWQVQRPSACWWLVFFCGPFFTVFELLSPALGPRLVFVKLEYLGICFAPYFALAFALHYTHRETWWQRWSPYFLLLPIFSLGVAWTDQWHGLLFERVTLSTDPIVNLVVEHGVWFNYVLLPYNYLYFLAALSVLLLSTFNEGRQYRRHVAYLALSFMVPFIGNVLFTVTGFTFWGLDPTPILFSVSALLLTASLFRTGFMKVAPLSYATIFTALEEGVILLNRDHQVVDINPSALAALAKGRQDVIDKNALKVLTPYRDLLLDHDLEQDLSVQLKHDAPQLRIEEVKLRPVHGTRGQVVGRALITRDVTREHQQRAELEHLAFHDSLTGLANRHAFMHEARKFLALAERYGWSLALLYLDLNKFKQINDRFGHDVGDSVLKHLAALLRRELRESDLAARLGGDEFVALLPQADRLVANRVSQRLQAAVAEPFSAHDLSLELSISIGLALYPEEGFDLETLLNRADSCMYAEKRTLA